MKKNLQKRPTQEAYERDNEWLKAAPDEMFVVKETYNRDTCVKRDLRKWPTKETYKRDNEWSIVAFDELFVVEETYNRAQRDHIHKKEIYRRDNE